MVTNIRPARAAVRAAVLALGFLSTCSVLGKESMWQTYTNTNYINDIIADDSVFVLATRGGLVWFDPGRVWALQKLVNTDGLPANNCLAAAFDSAGNLWVGTEGGGLAVVPKESSFALVYRPNDLPEKVTALAWDRDRLLLGTDRGLYVVEDPDTPLDFSDDIIKHYSVATRRELLSDRVLSLEVGDRYWVGTNQGVTSVGRSLESWTGYRRPLGDSVKAMAFWRDSLLVATERGLAVLESSGFRPVFTFAKPRTVSDVAVSGLDIYVATDTGLFRGDGMSQYRFELILSADARSLLVRDTVWVGLGGNVQAGQGLAFAATGQSWSILGLPGIKSAQVSALAFDPVTGSLHLCHYLTSWGYSAVTEIRPDGSIHTRSSPLINPIEVSCDSRGRVWFAHFASDGGLSVYDPGADTWGRVQWGPNSGWNVIDAFGIDRYDTKWVFNGEGMVVAVDSSGTRVEFDIPGLVPPPRGGFDFAFDSRGCVWLGLTVGLVRIDTRGTLRNRADDSYSIIANGLPATEVRSVAADPEDNIWLATPQGVAVWDGAGFRVYTSANSGLLDNNVYRVRADRSGRVWFLCQSGLSMYDRISGRWNNYTAQNSGLIKSEEGITDFYQALEIGTIRGIVVVGTQRGVSLLNIVPGQDTVSGLHILVYPNPCVLGVNDRVVISGLPEQSRVEIRTLTGMLVAQPIVDQGMRRAVWKPGRVATGVYLVEVLSPSGIRVERLALVGH